MRTLSKSKIMAFRQCTKRLWLEIHHPELLKNSDATEASYETGYKVGGVAQSIYDPNQSGVIIDFKVEGFKQALERSAALLTSSLPIFEAGFSANGALAFVDVMLPDNKDGVKSWHMVEVKSSTSLKDYHRDDIAIQTYIAQSAGVNLTSVSLAHIDNTWVYPGNENYLGLLTEVNLTEEAFSRTNEVKAWIEEAQRIVEYTEPEIETGDQCSRPFDCGFYEYCTRNDAQAEFPISWLPRFSRKKIKTLEARGIHDLKEVPDYLLNEKQKQVKEHTLKNTAFFDAESAKNSLKGLSLPAYFLDFETIIYAVPIWQGTRPYQQNTYQFSLHILNQNGKLAHTEFLDISGRDPSIGFAKKLIDVCGTDGPVFVYNAGFETARISELADRYPEYKREMLAINERVVDLLPIARNNYYHPSQQGSWSIKKVLPALVPSLNYANLEGVQDGGMAMSAFLEAIHPSTNIERKATIEKQLLEYCKLDTYAMVKLWQVFADRLDLTL